MRGKLENTSQANGGCTGNTIRSRLEHCSQKSKYWHGDYWVGSHRHRNRPSCNYREALPPQRGDLVFTAIDYVRRAFFWRRARIFPDS